MVSKYAAFRESSPSSDTHNIRLGATPVLPKARRRGYRAWGIPHNFILPAYLAIVALVAWLYVHASLWSLLMRVASYRVSQ